MYANTTHLNTNAFENNGNLEVNRAHYKNLVIN
jgi:hypothetical protein